MKSSECVQYLVRHRVLEKCANHSAGHHAARYRFVERVRKYDKLTQQFLQSARIIKRRGDRSCHILSQLKGSRMPRKPFDDLDQIRPGPSFFPVFGRKVEEMQELGKATHSILGLRETWKTRQTQMSVRHNRMTTHVCRTPPKLRALLLVAGEPAVEIDLPSSHPACLCKIFEPTTQSSDAERLEHQELVGLVRSGDFYTFFQDCWELDREQFLPFARPKGKRTEAELLPYKRAFLEQESRKGIKLCWQILINCAPSFHNTELCRRLQDRFPIFYRRFMGMKRTGKDVLGRKLRWHEANLIAALAASTDQPCATIYDGLLSNQSGIDQVMRHAAKITKEHLGFEHRPVQK